MSYTIKHEAVFPPAIYSLTRMAHSSPNRNVVMGSYELYDPQLDLCGEKRINGITGTTAPGSPGSAQDYKQLVANLQRELEESKRKETELQQILSDFGSAHSHSVSSFGDSQFLEGTASNDSVGENVKDAHIKHLQRQVTVLQANLYKSDGWASRVSSAMKERDMALDDVARLTNEVKNMQGEKHQLQCRIEMITTALQDTQQKLQQVSMELQNQAFNGHLVTQLREEITKQKSEIITLKESLTRLDMENRSLKDPSVDPSSQSLGNVACSQELEHLHKVVDTLKNTVLEQRSYLLNFRKPNSSSNAKSLQTSSSSASSSGTLNQESFSIRSNISPSHAAAAVTSADNGAIIAGGFTTQHSEFSHPGQAPGLRPPVIRGGGVGSLLDGRQLVHRTGSAPVYSQADSGSMRRKLNSQDADDVFDLDNSSSNLIALVEGLESSSDMSNLDSSSASTTQANQKSQLGNNSGHLGQKPIRAPVTNPATPQHRTSHSEVLAQRNVSPKVNLHQSGAKSETLGRQPRNSSAITSNNSSANVDISKFSQASAGMGISGAQRFQSARPVQQNVIFDGNVNINSHQQIYHPPSNYQEGLPYMLNHGTAVPQMAPPAPAPHRPATKAPTQEVVYVNTPLGRGTTSSSSTTPPGPGAASPAVGPGAGPPTDTDSAHARLNSDKLCPVCRSDFSHVTMEEFQTHVFECFDDEAAPETMKPQVHADRTCPMCNLKFSSTTLQHEFEKHVHSHFDVFEELLP